ncbi:sigma factor-like helix-turn-helix DNA-binding protein [Streptomyces mexicanus]|uniref:sigma factor-like helix-turn-helix DNA-binding protein n=1 Tax=Streptomyces mexicanus TaxID=178566 RepID=UPI0036582D1E
MCAATEDKSHDALRSLAPAHRQAIQATVFADRATQQAAEALGDPQGTVKSRVYYALRSLKSALEAGGVRPS